MIRRALLTIAIVGHIGAVWGQNECVTIAVPTICRTNGQLCFDADIATPSSSVCQCPSYLGFQNVMTPCTQTTACAASTTCSTANQACLPDSSGGAGFECGCIYPDYCAPALNVAATPRRDECIVQCPGCADKGDGNGNVCNVGGQLCADPDHTASPDFTCECPYPSTGTAGTQALAAACTHTGSECDLGTPANKLTCTAAGQKCIDLTVGNVANDWKCACLTSSQQSVMSAVADCQVDECTARCQTCAWKSGTFLNGGGNVCHRFGQFCVDPNKSSLSLNDWYCTCPQGTAAAATAVQEPLYCVPSVATDDCNTATNDMFTRLVDRCPSGQYCVDPTPTLTNGDWECRCLPPSTGAAVAGGAATCILNECLQENKGLRCLAIGQTCSEVGTDPSNAAHYDDWSCECVTPLTGTGAQKEATCTQVGGGSSGFCDFDGWKCHSVGQSCVSESPVVCGCPSPLVLTSGVCVLDECATYGTLCTALGQLCIDPVQTIDSMNDWYCSCPAPSYGERDGNFVKGWTCLTDECNSVCPTCPQNTTTGDHLCYSFGQTCSEGSQSVDYDWVCACAGDLSVITGSPTNATANCTLPVASTSECDLEENRAVCGSKKQTCVDPSAAIDDVTCACVVGVANVATPPSCDYDECADITALPFTTCAAAGQTCSDPNPDVSSMGDWTCSCIAPRVGINTAAAATTCDSYDECLVTANRDVCLNAGQICVDPVKTDVMVGDWQCQCPHDNTQLAVAAAVVCTYPPGQCGTNSANCGAAKYCNDIVGSYECLCPSPYTAAASMAATPACQYDECGVGTAGNALCTAAGQTCVDTDTATTALNTWECRCTAPETGSRPLAVATCTLDECSITPELKCPLISQECSDPNIYVLNSWICVQNMSNPIDECTDNSNMNNDTCTASGQLCVDPDTNATSTGDWACYCLGLNNVVTTVFQVGGVVPSCPAPTAVPPTPSPPTPVPVVTVLDECAVTPSPCGTQTCVDPVKTTASVGDFICSCVNVLQANSKAGGPATCDECADSATNASRCGNTSIACTDPKPTDTDLNDYVCSCPSGGNSVGAICSVNECASNPCGSLQTCTEDSLQISGDYKCECFGLWKIGAPVTGCDTYDYSLMFRIETTQQESTFSINQTMTSIINIINYLADGTTQDTLVTPSSCTTCAYIASANLRNECMEFGSVLASLCVLNATTTIVGREAGILQGASTGVGIFELVGTNEAKESWKDALLRSQTELQSDPAVSFQPGSLRFFPIATPTPVPQPVILTPPDSDDSGLEWYTILLLVLLILCCLIICIYLIMRYCKKKKEKKETEKDREMNDREAPHHVANVNSSSSLSDHQLVQNKISQAMTATQTSKDSSVSGLNPIPQAFPAPIATPVKQEYSPSLAYRDVSHQQRQTSVIAFGRHDEGQLGIGDHTIHDVSPVQVPDLNNVGITAISCGSFHTVILLVDHTLYACGEGGDGQLGFGSTLSVNIPTQIMFFKGKYPTLVACGEQHTLVACKGEGLYAMGSSGEGQLGIGDYSTRLKPTLVPMFQGKHIDMMSCSHHSVVVCQGSVFVTGWNEQGQLGLGDDRNRNQFTELEFFRGKRIKQVSAGVRHTVICTTDGVYTFGGNSYGQLGLGHAVRELSPQRIPFFDDKTVSCISSWFHTMVVCNDYLYTFGEGEFGKLGHSKDSSAVDRDVYQPERVPYFSGPDIHSVIACSEHSVVVTSNGVYIWGNGDAGSMGHGDLQITHPPDSRVHALDHYDVNLISCGTDHTMVYASSK